MFLIKQKIYILTLQQLHKINTGALHDLSYVLHDLSYVLVNGSQLLHSYNKERLITF